MHNTYHIMGIGGIKNYGDLVIKTFKLNEYVLENTEWHRLSTKCIKHFNESRKKFDKQVCSSNFLQSHIAVNTSDLTLTHR